jgi:poly(3-hydroxybutyrate) depolymerase
MSDCSDGASVILCTIDNHDHCWPLQEDCPWGNVAPDFPGNEVMLDFFESVELP